MTDPDDPIQLAQGAGFGSVGQVEQSLGTVARRPARDRSEPLDRAPDRRAWPSRRATRARSATVWTPT